jgi:Uma2 family endonuclease
MSFAQSEPEGYFSREAYRAWCDAQPRGRFERVEGRIVAMAPERGAHLLAKAAVYRALYRAVAAAGLSCQVLPDGATIETGDSDYEPDATVNCGALMAPDDIAAPNPVIVVEVLSPGTRAVDTGRKLFGYFLVPSIAHYLIVDPVRRRVIHHRRDGERIDTAILASGPIAMDPPGISITMDEIYEGQRA